ncbi:MAG: hypothetical protein RR409_05915 [Clostridium sp.]
MRQFEKSIDIKRGVASFNFSGCIFKVSPSWLGLEAQDVDLTQIK